MQKQNSKGATSRLAQPSKRETRRNPAPAAARALNILEYFGTARRAMRATDVARMFNFSPSTTDQLLKTLVDAAYLTFNPCTKFYFPSVRLLDFADMLTDHYNGRRFSRLVSELRAETGEKVWVCTLCDTHIQIVKSSDADDFSGRKYTIDSIPGSVLLSQHTDTEVRKIIARAILYRDCAPSQAEKLICSAAAARISDYASGDSVVPKWWALSVPVPRRTPDVSPLALTLCGDARRLRSRIPDLLRIINNGMTRVLHEPRPIRRSLKRAPRAAVTLQKT